MRTSFMNGPKDKLHHGVAEGPLGVEYPGFRTRMSDVFMEAARYLGFEEVHDFNDGGNQVGFGRFHMTTRYVEGIYLYHK